MAYNKSLDKELKQWKIESEDTAILVSVYAYNGGDKKLQIGPRTYAKKNGDVGYRKAGRLSVDETAKLAEILPEVTDTLSAV